MKKKLNVFALLLVMVLFFVTMVGCTSSTDKADQTTASTPDMTTSETSAEMTTETNKDTQVETDDETTTDAGEAITDDVGDETTADIDNETTADTEDNEVTDTKEETTQPETPVEGIALRFDENGTFEVAIFSDLRLSKTVDETVIENMVKLVDEIQPALVLFGGDIHDGSVTNEAELRIVLDAINAPLAERGIKWCHTFGVDSEGKGGSTTGFTRAEQYAVYSAYEYCITPETAEGVYGNSNYVLPIKHAEGDKVGFNLWCLDTNGYLNDYEEGMEEGVLLDKTMAGGTNFDTIHFSQILWYWKQSMVFEKANDGNKVPGMMYFQIPAYQLLYLRLNPELGEATGTMQKLPSASERDSGIVWTCFERGDIKGIFCGYDAQNDFAGKYLDMIMAGCSSIGAGSDELTAGARVVSISQNGATVESHMAYLVDMEREDMKLPNATNRVTAEQMYAACVNADDTQTNATLAPDGGYATFTSTGTDPHFTIVQDGKIYDAETGFYWYPFSCGNYMVIKYRMSSSIDQNATLPGNQIKGYTIYEGGDIGTWPLWYWEADGEWNYVIVDISGFTGKGNATLRFDYVDTKDVTLQVAYQAFFDNKDAAVAYAAADDNSLGCRYFTYQRGISQAHKNPYIENIWLDPDVNPDDSGDITHPELNIPTNPTNVITPEMMYVASTSSHTGNVGNIATLEDGYVTVASTNGDPHFTIVDGGKIYNPLTETYDIPFVSGSFVVIKYRISSAIDHNATINGNQLKGYTIYEGGSLGTWPLWYWEADAKWNYVIIDISMFTGNKDAYLRFDYADVKGVELNVAYQAFFDSKEDAITYAAADDNSLGCRYFAYNAMDGHKAPTIENIELKSWTDSDHSDNTTVPDDNVSQVITYIDFDGDAVDELGNATVAPKNMTDNVEYMDGKVGQAANFTGGNGSFTVDNFNHGTKSFSVGMWVNVHSITGDPVLVANKACSSRATGFLVITWNGKIRAQVSANNTAYNADAMLPENYSEEWVYILFIVDRENNQIKLSLNFGDFVVTDISDIAGIDISTDYPLTIGDQAGSVYGKTLDAAIDEFMFVDGALTDLEVESLRNHYAP